MLRVADGTVTRKAATIVIPQRRKTGLVASYRDINSYVVISPRFRRIAALLLLLLTDWHRRSVSGNRGRNAGCLRWPNKRATRCTARGGVSCRLPAYKSLLHRPGVNLRPGTLRGL